MTVKTERIGRIWRVAIDRPECRNAVDGPTAADLVAANRAMEAGKLGGFDVVMYLVGQ